MNKPRILITNDDGIYSKGIYALWQAMNELGHTFVVAPDNEQSAKSHSITINNPLRVQEIERENGFKGYAVSGTPADCAKIAIRSLMIDQPDILISGINQGANLGTNLIYSGTVSAAAEGAMLGISSIAISLASFKSDDYGTAQKVAANVVKHVMKNNLPRGTLLNVNVPECNEKMINGFRITRQGNQNFLDEFEERFNPRQETYYWIKGRVIDEDRSIDFDGKALSENYVSITPVHYRLTNESYLEELKRQFLDE